MLLITKNYLPLDAKSRKMKWKAQKDHDYTDSKVKSSYFFMAVGFMNRYKNLNNICFTLESQKDTH